MHSYRQVMLDISMAPLRYSWVLLLGGINDIGTGTSSDAVAQGLMHMYRSISRHKARVLAMTCLENRGSVMQSNYEVRPQRS